MRRFSALLFLLAGLGVTAVLVPQQNVPPEMTTYYVAFLKRGPKWTPGETPELQRLQEAHLAHIREMFGKGKLVTAGPFTDGGELRGMFIFQVGSLEEAQALSNDDPAVKAGRLVIELHPWFAAKGLSVPR